MGLFDTYSELGQRAYTIFRGTSYEPYAQDSWKVSPKLTVNYGMRYTVIVPYHALWGNMIVFDPALYDPSKAVTIDREDRRRDHRPGTRPLQRNGDSGHRLAVFGQGPFPEATAGTYDYLFRGGNYPDYFSDIRWGQLQPRAGFAYQMNDKTVIRAGGGRFFTRLGVSDSVFLGGNPPFQPTANVSFGSADNPGGISANSLPLTVTTQSTRLQESRSLELELHPRARVFVTFIISVGYVGRRGLHLQRESNINQPLPSIVLPTPA